MYFFLTNAEMYLKGEWFTLLLVAIVLHIKTSSSKNP